nr:hypothetical protein OH837_39085 [Streptomyces canus]
MADAGQVGGHNGDGALWVRCLVAAVILAGVIQVEIVHGDLRRAALPIAAALGGVVVSARFQPATQTDLRFQRK